MISFTTTVDEDGRVLSVEGEVDLDTATELQDAVLGAVNSDNSGVTKVTVDLSQVSFLNSSGLNVLLAGLKEAQAKGIAFTVAHPQPQVRKVIDMVGLSEVLGLSS